MDINETIMNDMEINNSSSTGDKRKFSDPMLVNDGVVCDIASAKKQTLNLTLVPVSGLAIIKAKVGLDQPRPEL